MPVLFRSSPISSHTNASWRGLDRNSSNNTILKAANPSCTPIQVSAIPPGFNECFSHPNKDPTYTQFPRHFFTGALSCLGSSCRDTTSEGMPRLLAACNFLKALIQSKPPASQDINNMSYVIMTVNMQLGVRSDSQSEKLVTVDTEETCRILGTSPWLSDFPERLLLHSTIHFSFALSRNLSVSVNTHLEQQLQNIPET